MRLSILSKIIITAFFLASCSTTQSTMNTTNNNTLQSENGLTSFNINTQSPQSLMRLAKGFQQTGDYLNAIKFYGEATAKNPNIIEAWLGIVGLLIEIENPIGARVAINDALKHYPNDVNLAIYLAQIDIASDLPTQALQTLAPHMNGRDSRILNLLGVASEMMGSTSLARSYYSQALAQTSNMTRIINNYALSFSFYGDQQAAISMLQQNLNNANTRKEGYEILAIIYAIDGQMDAALTIATSALSKEEAQANYSFYETLPKLLPSMRARAVFTRSIPIDAIQYLNQTAQEFNQPVPKNETKANLARQLVLSGTVSSTGKPPPTVQSEQQPKKITIDIQKDQAKEPEPEIPLEEQIIPKHAEQATAGKKGVLDISIDKEELAETAAAKESATDDKPMSQDPVQEAPAEKDKIQEEPIDDASLQAAKVEEEKTLIGGEEDQPISKSGKDNAITKPESDEVPDNDIAKAPELEKTEDKSADTPEEGAKAVSTNEEASNKSTSVASDNATESETKPVDVANAEPKASITDDAGPKADKETPAINKNNTAAANKRTYEEEAVIDLPDTNSENVNEPETEIFLTETLATAEPPVEARDAFRVQIGSFSDIIAAGNEWCRIYKRVAMAGLDVHPNIRIFGEGDNVRHRLLLGEYENREDANTACSDLTGQKVGCYVVKGAGVLRPLESSCKTSDIKSD